MLYSKYTFVYHQSESNFRLILSYMKNFVLIILLSLFITNCKQDTNDSKSHAFVGGEIVNPNSRYVVLSRGALAIDTVLLDANNRFLYKIEDLDSGIYTFKHRPEEQIVLLEEGDSLHFRLNTMEFDESLVFTGKGAKKNNYLINLFLENEKEREYMLEFSQLSPEEFRHKVDSITHAKHERLKKFERKNSTSEIFNEIADANIHYYNYARKELYPFAYYGNNELINLRSLPNDFYDYRKDVNYNNENLRNYFPYFRFLEYHFNNIALSKHFKHSSDSVFKRNSLDYNLDRLNIIDSLVTNNSIKNSHMKHSAWAFLDSNNKAAEISQFIEVYLEKSTNESHKKEITNVAKGCMKLTPGTKVPNIALINHEGEEVSLPSIIKKPTVIYFWSYRWRRHFKEAHLKAQKLKKHYPDIDFIAISANKLSSQNWEKALKKYKFPIVNEYQFVKPEDAKKQLVISRLNKVMLINEDGIIVHGNANMASHYFEEQVLGLLNQ